jgi:hypothetical protein
MGQCIAMEEVRKLRGESRPLQELTCSAQRFNRKHEGHQETSKPAARFLMRIWLWSNDAPNRQGAPIF